MKTRKIQTRIPKLDLSGRFLAETINEEARTVEMIFSTSTPVRMARWKGWDIEHYNEILSMEKAHVRLVRMQKGAPLLDSHNSYRLSAQLGVIDKVWLEGEELRGVVRFSKRAEVEPIFQDVKDGIIRNGSIGYRVHSYKDESKEGDKIKTLRAVDWEPFEMSLVTIGADENAQVRSESEATETNECEILVLENNNERTLKMDLKDTPTPPAAPSPADLEKVRAEERERNAKILRSCRQAQLPEIFAEELVRSKLTYEQCLEQIQEKWAEQDAQRAIKPAADVRVEMGGLDEVQTRREGAAEAILVRAMPQDHKPTDKSRKFHGRSALDLCRVILEMNGIRTDMMGPNEIVKRAFHSTSDFPAILENVASQRLQKSYESVTQLFRMFAVESTLKDFKPTSVAHLGEAPELVKLGEGAEIKFGTMGDSKEVYKLATYAKALAVTRETIFNDALGAFAKLADSYGRAAAHLENQVAMEEAFLDNPLMGDGVALFDSAAHKNVSTPAGVPSEATLSKMKALLRKQTDDKGRILNLTARFWLVGADYESDAKKVLAAQSKEGGFNVHGNEFDLMVDATMGMEHVLIADPSKIEGLEFAYLEGARGLQIETKDHPGTLGVIVRAYLDFAAKAINHRAFVRNAGS